MWLVIRSIILRGAGFTSLPPKCVTIPYNERERENMRDLARFLTSSAPTGGYGVEPLTPSELKQWREIMSAERARYGFCPVHAPLLTTDNDKLGKSTVPSFGLSLAPAGTSDIWNVCRYSSPGCRAVCLATAGNGRYDSVTRARQYRTALLADHPALFIRVMAHEIRNLAAKHGEIRFRPNVLADLPWELFAPDLFSLTFDNGDAVPVKNYDYTKWPSDKRGHIPNYRLVGSVHEKHTDSQIRGMVKDYGSAAVVFDTLRGKPLPATYTAHNITVIDGDKSDDRTMASETGVIIGLRAKGQAIGATGNTFIRTA